MQQPPSNGPQSSHGHKRGSRAVRLFRGIFTSPLTTNRVRSDTLGRAGVANDGQLLQIASPRHGQQSWRLELRVVADPDHENAQTTATPVRQQTEFTPAAARPHRQPMSGASSDPQPIRSRVPDPTAALTKRVGCRRTVLREIVTDRPVRNPIIKAPSRRFQLAPAQKALWLHTELATPMKEAVTPAAITLSPTLAVSAGPTMLTAVRHQPPPQLMKLRGPAAVVSSMQQQPLPPCPIAESIAETSTTTSTSTTPTRTPTRTNSIVGRVAEAVRHFNAMQGGGIIVHSPRDRRDPATAATADTADTADTATTATAAAPPPTVAATVAKDDQRPPRPSMDELLAKFEEFGRRRRARAAAETDAEAVSEMPEVRAEKETDGPGADSQQRVGLLVWVTAMNFTQPGFLVVSIGIVGMLAICLALMGLKS